MLSTAVRRSALLGNLRAGARAHLWRSWPRTQPENASFYTVTLCSLSSFLTVTSLDVSGDLGLEDRRKAPAQLLRPDRVAVVADVHPVEEDRLWMVVEERC